MTARIENDVFVVDYDLDGGAVTITRRDGTFVLAESAVRARTAPQPRSTSDAAYTRSAQVETVRDELGAGERLVVDCVDDAEVLDFAVRITLYERLESVVLEASCRNRSATDLTVESMEPVRAVPRRRGGFHWSGARAALTNGYSFQDPGRVLELSSLQPQPVQSRWNMGLSRGAEPGGLVLGFLDHHVAEGTISLAPDENAMPPGREHPAALTMTSLYSRGFLLPPNAQAESGRVIFLFAPHDHSALEAYAQLLAELYHVRLKRPVTGWCHWSYTHELFDEQEILANAEVVARALKPWGAEYVQIDGPWQRAYGDWEPSDNFPHGMRWLAEQIRGLGLKPGLWICPYLIQEGTEVAASHPEWLVRDLDGEPVQCGMATESALEAGYYIPSFSPRLYGLDVTHPAATQWLHELFRKISREWGYEFFKLDFIDHALLSAERYFDATVGKAAAHRKGLATIRDAVGPDAHLLVCGAAPPVIKYLDSTRIQWDNPHLTWDQYVGYSNSSGPAMAKRYYFNDRTWVNDADHIGVELLTMNQAEAAATIVALSGGNTLVDDRLVNLDPTRLEVLKKILPVYGKAARPLDLFEKDKPEVFALPVERDFGKWTLLALFNYDDRATAEMEVHLERAGLDPTSVHVGYDFWRQRFVGEFEELLQVRLGPSSVMLLAVHEKPDAPRVIATDRHFSQGAVELESVEWDADTCTLSGVSLGSPGIAYNLVVYVPEPYRWAQDWSRYFHERGAFSLRSRDPGVLLVHVRFADTSKVQWNVAFERQGR